MSRRGTQSPTEEIKHPLVAWQYPGISPELATRVRLLLVDIATHRAQAVEARLGRRGRFQSSAGEIRDTAERWRRVASGLAVGDAACLIGLSRGLAAERSSGRLDVKCLDAALSALSMAVVDGNDSEQRIVAGVELLATLPEVIAGHDLPKARRVRRARALACLFRQHDLLRWHVGDGGSLYRQLSMLRIIAAFTAVEADALRKGLFAAKSDKQTLSDAIRDLMRAERGQDGDKPAETDAADGPRVGWDDLSPAGAAMGRLSLVPFPGFDPNRLSESRTGLAKRYAGLGTRLPLAPVPSAQAADAALGRLADEMPNFAAVLECIGDELALDRRIASEAPLRLPCLLLVGPPGIGKTRFARRLAADLGTAYACLSLAGASDNRELSGTARGWSSAHPSWPVEQLALLRTGNPLLMIDEVEKAGGSDGNGRPLQTMLALLENTTARHIYDECIGGPIDLSRISWILTANTLQDLPAPLLSRVIVHRVPAPAPDQVGGLLATMLVDVAQERGLADSRLLPSIPQIMEERLRADYTVHRDPRQLRSALVRALAATAHAEEGQAASIARLN